MSKGYDALVEGWVKQIEALKSENARLRAEVAAKNRQLGLSDDWQKCQMEFARLENAVDKISKDRDSWRTLAEKLKAELETQRRHCSEADFELHQANKLAEKCREFISDIRPFLGYEKEATINKRADAILALFPGEAKEK